MVNLSVIVHGLKAQEDLGAALAQFQPLRGPGSELIVALTTLASIDATHAADVAEQIVVSDGTTASALNQAAMCARGDVLVFVHASSILPEKTIALIMHALAPGNRVWGRFDLRFSGSPVTLRVIEKLYNLWSRFMGSGNLHQAIFATRLAYEQAGRFSATPVFTDLAFSRALKQLSRPACIRTPVIISSREMERKGIWRSALFTAWLGLSFRIGVDPVLLHLLAQRYQALDAVAATE